MEELSKKRSRIPLQETNKNERMPHSKQRELKHPLFMQSIHEWTARVNPQQSCGTYTRKSSDSR